GVRRAGRRRAAAAVLPMGGRRFARREFWDMTEPMRVMPPPAVRSRFGDWLCAIKSIIGFWCFYALTVVVRAFLGTDPWTTLKDKLVIIAIGVVLTGLIYLSIASIGEGAGIRRKAIIAAVASTIASAVMGTTLVFI